MEVVVGSKVAAVRQREREGKQSESESCAESPREDVERVLRSASIAS